MKNSISTSLSIAALLSLLATPLVYGGKGADRSSGPCFRVTVQNDRVNESNVRQDCEWNVNRTVQAGKINRAYTHQTGRVNNNKVRQYNYDASKYFGPRRHD